MGADADLQGHKYLRYVLEMHSLYAHVIEYQECQKRTRQNKIKLNSSKTSSTFKKETAFLWFLLVLARADMFLSNKQHSQNPTYRTLSGCFKIFWTKSSTSETPRVVLGKRKQINKINKKKEKKYTEFWRKEMFMVTVSWAHVFTLHNGFLEGRKMLHFHKKSLQHDRSHPCSVSWNAALSKKSKMPLSASSRGSNFHLTCLLKIKVQTEKNAENRKMS